MEKVGKLPLYIPFRPFRSRSSCNLKKPYGGCSVRVSECLRARERQMKGREVARSDVYIYTYTTSCGEGLKSLLLAAVQSMPGAAVERRNFCL